MANKATAPTLASITFDCADALVAARFWAEVLHRQVGADATSDYAQVVAEGDTAWSFTAVPEPKAGKNRLHVDLDVPDLAAEVARLIGLGATRLGDYDEDGYRWTTLADPEGNEFDVVTAAG